MPLIFCGATDFLRRKYINIRESSARKVSRWRVGLSLRSSLRSAPLRETILLKNQFTKVFLTSFEVVK